QRKYFGPATFTSGILSTGLPCPMKTTRLSCKLFNSQGIYLGDGINYPISYGPANDTKFAWLFPQIGLGVETEAGSANLPSVVAKFDKRIHYMTYRGGNYYVVTSYDIP